MQSHRIYDLLGVALLCVFALPSVSSAAEPTYWQDARPIFRKHCTVCHSEKNRAETDVSAGLALDTYAGVLKGGRTKVVKPGDAVNSLLIHVLRHPKQEKRMPLDANPLPDETVAVLRAWIDAGAREGTKPAEAAAVSTISSSPPARLKQLDVVLPTKLQRPPKLELALKIGPLPPVAAVAYSPDGNLLATGSYGRVMIWDARQTKAIKLITNVLGAVNDLKFSPDGQLLAVAGGQPSARGDLRLFDTRDWKLLGHLGGHLDVVACVAFTPDGKTLASASFDKTVRLWDVARRQLKLSIPSHSDFVYAVAFAPQGDWLVTASKDRTVRLSETATGKSRFTFSGMEQDVLAVAVAPGGGQVVSSGYETALHWWNAQTGASGKLQRGHDVAVHELAFDKAGKLLASAGADKTVRLWNGSTGDPLRSLPAGSIVYSVAVRSDCAQVAGGCFDGTVHIWDTASGRPLLTLISAGGTADELDWLALTPEGYVTTSNALAARGQWRSGGKALPSSAFWAALRQPELVFRAWRGEKIAEPSLPVR